MLKKREIPNPVQFSIPGYANGSPAIVSFDDPGEQTVYVVASDGVGGLDFKSAQLEILKPESSECAAKPMIAVFARVSSLEEDTAEIRVAAPKNMGNHLRYAYDFGDGTTLNSSHAYVTHNYQLRDQSEPTSSFIIKVRAQDENGKAVVGRASVAFRNGYWLSTVVGSPMIPVLYNRFPEKCGFSYDKARHNYLYPGAELTRPCCAP